MANEPSKAERLAELNHLHQAGDISDTDYELLKGELLPPSSSSKRRWVVYVASAVLVLAAAALVAVLLRDGSAESETNAGVVSTAPLSTEPNQTSVVTTPTTTTIPPTTTTIPPPDPDRARVVFVQSLNDSGLRLETVKVMAQVRAMIDLQPDWVLNGATVDTIGDCTYDLWAERSGAVTAINDTIASLQVGDPTLDGLNSVWGLVPKSVQARVGEDDAGQFAAAHECAGYAPDTAAALGREAAESVLG